MLFEIRGLGRWLPERSRGWSLVADPLHPGHLQRSLGHSRHCAQGCLRAWAGRISAPCFPQAWPLSGPHQAHCGDGNYVLGTLLLPGSRVRGLGWAAGWQSSTEKCYSPLREAPANYHGRKENKEPSKTPANLRQTCFPRGPAASPGLDNLKSLPADSFNLHPDA